jgi:hypothetical protein
MLKRRRNKRDGMLFVLVKVNVSENLSQQMAKLKTQGQ